MKLRDLFVLILMIVFNETFEFVVKIDQTLSAVVVGIIFYLMIYGYILNICDYIAKKITNLIDSGVEM